MKNIFIIWLSIILWFTLWLIYTNIDSWNQIILKNQKDITEQELENLFRNHTVSGNQAVAMKLDFQIPVSWTAYLWTIHWYPNNLSVCEELLAPYNSGEIEVMQWNFYYCEVLK